MDDKKVGEILLSQQIIDARQLAEALERQKDIVPRPLLGNLLVRLGYVEEAVLRQLLDEHEKRRSLAEVLIDDNRLSREDLAIALEMSRNESLPLSRVLLNLEFISEADLAKAIATSADCPFVHLDNRRSNVKTGLANAVMAHSRPPHKMVPVDVEGSVITVAMNSPLSVQELRRLENLIKLKVEMVIAPEQEILVAQKKYSVLSVAGHAEEKRPDISENILSLIEEEGEETDVDQDARLVAETDSLLVKLVNKIIFDACQLKASDIHIEPYPGKREIVVRMRIDGKCSIYQTLPSKYKYAIPSRIKIMAELDISERRKPQDGKIDFRKFAPADVELRVATMPTVGQLEDVVIRVLNVGEPLPFEQLGLTERNRSIFENSVQKPYGLVLVVGPTGSGKTTTLHSAIAMVNKPKIKIWTAEDPVEITQEGLRQVQINPKTGLTFAKALRSFLRLDPDVIMVGEMRDSETAAIAVEASLTGHLVLSTLHTNSAPETVTRLLEMGLDPYSFSDSLLCILAQRLAARICSRCMVQYRPGEEEIDDLIAEYGAEAFAATGIRRESILLPKAGGCDHCYNTGFRGRIGIHELLECSDSIKGMIKKKADASAIRDLAVAEGMTTLKQDGMLKVLKGLTDLHEIRRVCIR